MKIPRSDIVDLRNTLDDFLEENREDYVDTVELLENSDSSRVAHLVIAIAILAYASSAH